jgi:hypothetical protein
MSKAQFMALWAVGMIAYLYVLGVAAVFGISSMFEDHDGPLGSLELFVDAFFNVLMLPGKWLWPDPSNKPEDMYAIALGFALNFACWGMLLPLTWVGLRRVTRTPSTIAR